MDIDADPGATRPGATEPISARRFHEAEGVEDWRVLGEGACTYFRTGSFAAGARLVAAIGGLAGLDDHHPDVDVRHGGVTVRLITITDNYYGLSGRDLLSRLRDANSARLSCWDVCSHWRTSSRIGSTSTASFERSSASPIR